MIKHKAIKYKIVDGELMERGTRVIGDPFEGCLYRARVEIGEIKADNEVGWRVVIEEGWPDIPDQDTDVEWSVSLTEGWITSSSWIDKHIAIRHAEMWLDNKQDAILSREYILG